MEKKQTPTHFAISPEDYAEYQELKAKVSKKEIDYSRLKTGSMVMIKCTNEFCSSSDWLDYGKPFNVIFYKTPYFIIDDGFQNKGHHSSYITFEQDGKYALFSSGENTDYITEVIEY